MNSTAAAITSATEGHDKIIDRIADFEEKQAKRPDFEPLKPITFTKSPNPSWTYGDGVTTTSSTTTTSTTHVEIDPYAPGRPMLSNYRLLVSGIAPRPVGFLSTLSNDTKSANLAPFSYFQVIDHDPPMFIIGFSSRPERAKDTFVNLAENGECVINTVSEDMIEAVNATSIDAPFGVSEWAVSGLTQAPSATVRASRVKESVFSIECKVVDIKEFRDHARDGLSVAATALVKATRFWVRADATNEAVDRVDLEKLRPVGQLGGSAYARVSEVFEVPRRKWVDEVGKSEILSGLQKGQEGVEVRDTVEEAQRATEGR